MGKSWRIVAGPAPRKSRVRHHSLVFNRPEHAIYLALAREFVPLAFQDSAWDIGNRALYEPRRKRPEHRSEQAFSQRSG